MIKIFNTALAVQTVLEAKEIPFCFIGGISILRWGEVRTTNDVDLTVQCGIGNEENIIDLLLNSFSPRIKDAKEFALRNRVLLIADTQTVPIDISLSGLNYEEEMISRSSKHYYTPDINLRTCSVEDLIILKAFADRDKDWFDIKGIIARKHNLNSNFILSTLDSLCQLKEDDAIVPKLQNLLTHNS